MLFVSISEAAMAKESTTGTLYTPMERAFKELRGPLASVFLPQPPTIPMVQTQSEIAFTNVLMLDHR